MSPYSITPTLPGRKNNTNFKYNRSLWRPKQVADARSQSFCIVSS